MACECSTHRPKHRGRSGENSSIEAILIILFLLLEIALRMQAGRADMWSIFCLADVAAVATLPPQFVITVEEVAVGEA